MTVKYDGQRVLIAGEEYVVPALSYGQLKQLKPEFKVIAAKNEGLDSNQHEAVLTIIHAALSRNYPDLSLDDVGEMVDLRNGPKLLTIVMGVSGLEAKEASDSGPTQEGNVGE